MNNDLYNDINNVCLTNIKDKTIYNKPVIMSHILTVIITLMVGAYLFTTPKIPAKWEGGNCLLSHNDCIDPFSPFLIENNEIVRHGKIPLHKIATQFINTEPILFNKPYGTQHNFSELSNQQNEIIKLYSVTLKEGEDQLIVLKEKCGPLLPPIKEKKEVKSLSQFNDAIQCALTTGKTILEPIDNIYEQFLNTTIQYKYKHKLSLDYKPIRMHQQYLNQYLIEEFILYEMHKMTTNQLLYHTKIFLYISGNDIQHQLNKTNERPINSDKFMIDHLTDEEAMKVTHEFIELSYSL